MTQESDLVHETDQNILDDQREEAQRAAQEAERPARLTFQEKLARFVFLEQERRDLEAKLKTNAAEAGLLEEPLLEQFSELGMSNARVSGLTVYIHSQLWAGAAKKEVELADGTTEIVGDAETTCQALIEAGLGEFVKPGFNVMTVSAWARELPVNEETGLPVLPPEMVGRITLTRKFSLRTRR